MIAGCAQINFNGGVNQIQLAIYAPLCIDVQDASTASGAHIQAYACGAGKRSQEWMLKPVNLNMLGQYTIVNANSQMCMSVADTPDTAPGQYVIQEPCASNDSPPNQTWTISPVPNGEAGMRFVSTASGQCLDLPYGATASVFDMQQYYCTATDPAQGWTINPVEPGSTP